MQIPINVWDPIHFAELRYKEALFRAADWYDSDHGGIQSVPFVALRDLGIRTSVFASLAGCVFVEMILSSTAFAYLWPQAVEWNDHALVVCSNLALAGLFLPSSF